MCLDDTTLLAHSPEPPRSHCHAPLHGPHECTICVFEELVIPTVPKAVSNLFSANDPPNDDVLPSFLASLNAIRSVSTHIQNCIDAMQSALAQMQHAKATCVQSINQHEAVVHPIRYIPDDILLNIFEWHSWSPQTGLTRAPWRLSHVTQRWRALALSSASLWSTIDIPCRALVTKEDHQRLTSKWDVILQRSMQSDLSVRLVYIVARTEDFVHVLPPTTRRWRRLELSTRTDFPALLRHCDFDRLDQLVLFGNPEYGETVSMFTRAPNLRCLTLDGYVEIDVLWDSITSYSCTFHGLRYLHRFSALEHLALDFFTTPGNTGIFPPEVPIPLSLPTLRTLSMYYPVHVSPCMRDISKLLHIPSLTTLTIFSGSNPLPIFSGPRLPHLRELCLRSTRPPSEIIEFFTLYGSAVTSLHIRTIELLRAVADRPIMFPNLRILSLDASLVKRDPEGVSVGNVLEQRCKEPGNGYVARLGELRISGMQQEVREAVGVVERWNTEVVGFKAKMPRSLSLPRLRSLEITQSSEERSFCRYASQRLHVPSLTTLLIRSWNMKLPAFPGDLPHLRHISLMSTAPPAEIDAFLARYLSITSLHLMSPHVVQMWHSHSTLLPNLAILRMVANTLSSDPVRVIEALEFPCEKKVELRISGKEMALAKASDVISKIDGLEERWDAVCAKLGIVVCLFGGIEPPQILHWAPNSEEREKWTTP